MLDNTPPLSMNYLRRNPKKEQMIEDRYTEIERANRILLEKMSNIIVSKELLILQYFLFKVLQYLLKTN